MVQLLVTEFVTGENWEPLGNIAISIKDLPQNISDTPEVCVIDRE